MWVDLEGTAAQVAALNSPSGWSTRAITARPRHRRPGDPERGPTCGRSINAPVRHDREPGAPALRRARRRRLPGLRRRHGRPHTGRPQGRRTGEGGPTLIAIGGYQDGKPFVLTEVLVGCWGARGRDGLEGVEPPRQPLEPAGRAGGERAAAACTDTGRPRLGRAPTVPRRPRASARAAGRRVVLTVRSDSARPPPLRDPRRGRCAVVEHDPLGRGERSVATMPMEALQLRRATSSTTSPPAAAAAACRSARPGARARGRPRREGERRGGARALRRRDRGRQGRTPRA